MARRHAVAVAIKHHAGEEAGLARSSAALAPGSIAGKLLLNGIPQWLIDDRRVLATMELALVNDLAAIGAVLQHLVERAARKRLPAHEPPGSARPRLTFDPARFELRLQQSDRAEFGIAPENQTNGIRLAVDRDELVVLHSIAERRHPPPPPPPLFFGGGLFTHALPQNP